ncbi:histidine phosphatase family protein [Iamia sp.]|uniref:histidine phosphatase family protein n=1 Tax=Iamia sp. TaxID=2722710 RepID=UPI002BE30D83|nr:histidine phosphatase family protein [Iamia sp.]HXH58834.1 histidine phosphatase family protein [Iamia sp.]
MSNGSRILLVRHGESTWNATGRWQGQADPPLTDRGRDQARSAAARLPPVAAVVASDLQRARETALILAEPQERAVTVDEVLRERDAGAFSGLTRADIHARHPGLLPDDPARAPGTEGDGLVPPPGWEPDATLARRAWEGIERLAATLDGTPGSTGLVVTHSGLIYAVEAALGGKRHRIANLEGRELRHDGRRWTLGPRRLLLDPAADEVTSPDQL